jgi:hypothetical protein
MPTIEAAMGSDGQFQKFVHRSTTLSSDSRVERRKSRFRAAEVSDAIRVQRLCRRDTVGRAKLFGVSHDALPLNCMVGGLHADHLRGFRVRSPQLSAGKIVSEHR